MDAKLAGRPRAKRPVGASLRKRAKTPSTKTEAAASLEAAAFRLEPPETVPPQLAEVRLWSQKNSLDGDIPIFANVRIDGLVIEGENVDYRAFIRFAHLSLTCPGFRQVPEEPSYRRKLTAEEASGSIERIQKRTTEGSLGGEVSAGSKNQWVSLKAGLSGKRSKKVEDATKTKASLDLTLIQDLPNLRWRIGDREQGDMRKSDGFLGDTYFFHDCPERKPLCTLVLTKNQPGAQQANGKKRERFVQAKVSISLKPSEGVHIVHDGDYTSVSGVSQAERDNSFRPAFIDRLRALALDKYIGGGDFVIATHELRVVPADGDEP